MHFNKFSFGTLQIVGSTYEQDVVVDRGEIRKRKKSHSKKFPNEFGHTPLSFEEDRWMTQLETRTHRNVLVVAVANKLARRPFPLFLNIPLAVTRRTIYLCQREC
jgi:hypothetical protein